VSRQLLAPDTMMLRDNWSCKRHVNFVTIILL